MRYSSGASAYEAEISSEKENAAYVSLNYGLDNGEETDEILLQAKLVTENEGWARTRNKIFRSGDAGQSWREITPPASTSIIYDAFFLTPSQGWLVRSNSQTGLFGEPGLEILRTNDGGNNWTRSEVGAFKNDFSTFFGGEVSIDFTDDNQGWTSVRQASGSNFSRGILLHTTDGGKSWAELPEPPIFSRIEFINEKNGWMAGGVNGDELYATHDSGKSWVRIDLAPENEGGSSYFYGLPEFRDSFYGVLPVLTTKFNKSTIQFFETANGGYTWRLKTALDLSKNDVENNPKVIFSVNQAGKIAAALPSVKNLYFEEPNKSAKRIPVDLLPGENVASLDFAGNSGWLLTSYGVCESFKENCSQTTRLLKVFEDGVQGLKDISPVARQTNEKKGENNLSKAVVVSNNNRGFDKCTAASVSQMQTWWNTSPFRDTNIYVGGVNRGCTQGNLNASWVAQIFAQGWKIIPTWVGPQAPCSTCTRCSPHSSDPVTASAQGREEADKATDALNALGLTPPTIIYYDMETYNSNTACSAAVRSFLDGWMQRVRERGNKAGVYGAPGNMANDLMVIPNQPDAIWVARWNGQATVWGLAPLPDSYMNNHQRIHQYLGDHDETYGGVTFNIDSNFADGLVASNENIPNRNRKTVGVFRPSNGITYLRNSNSGGFADVSMVYGVNGDTSFAGDWNGDKIDSVGIYRNGVFYLRNSNTTGAADVVFAFGEPGDQPVAGDWNGDGVDTIGVYRPTNGVFMLRNSNSSGAPDVTFVLGNPGDVAIAGDWNGDGTTTTGVFRPTNGIVYLKNKNVSGDADVYLVYGVAGDKPLAGDWDGDGFDSIGIYRNGVFYLRNSNTQGVADIVFALGDAGDEPVSGDWDGLP